MKKITLISLETENFTGHPIQEWVIKNLDDDIWIKLSYESFQSNEVAIIQIMLDKKFKNLTDYF